MPSSACRFWRDIFSSANTYTARSQFSSCHKMVTGQIKVLQGSGKVWSYIAMIDVPLVDGEWCGSKLKRSHRLLILDHCCASSQCAHLIARDSMPLESSYRGVLNLSQVRLFSSLFSCNCPSRLIELVGVVASPLRSGVLTSTGDGCDIPVGSFQHWSGTRAFLSKLVPSTPKKKLLCSRVQRP